MMTERDRIDELEEEVRQLREMLAPAPNKYPVEWGLTTGQARLLAAFCAKPDGFLSHDAMVAIYVKWRDGGDLRYASVIACLMNHKLRSHGVVLENKFGYGYQISPAHRVRIAKAVAARAIANEVARELAVAH